MREADAPCFVYECVRDLGLSGCYECAESTCRSSKWSSAHCPLRIRFGGEDAGFGFKERLDATRGAATVGGTWAQLPGRKAQRLHGYLLVLDSYARENVVTVSSHQLARGVGVRASLVRRDLSELGNFGTPGRGYGVPRLAAEIRRILRLERTRGAVWLGNASGLSSRASQRAFEMANCGLVGVFDDRSQGQSADGYIVQPLHKAPTEVKRRGATVAVLAGEEAADPKLLGGLVRAGIQALLNLTTTRPQLPPAVIVEQCDLGSQLLCLISRIGGDVEDQSKGED
jgi:redox-sensing transcriptional repressor